jgi:bifunctional DNase/RNase
MIRRDQGVCLFLNIFLIIIVGACSGEEERNPLTGDRGAAPAGMTEMKVMGLAMDPNTYDISVILSDPQEERALVITIGDCEAQAISLKLQDIPTERPMTHDLLRSVIEAMNGALGWIAVTEIRGDVYMAEIAIEREGLAPLRIDSRPSDAIALALGISAPIYVAEELIKQLGIPIPQEKEQEKALPLPEEREGSPDFSLSVHPETPLGGET